jgi:hypothetical protein
MRRLVVVRLFNTALTAFLAVSATGAEAGNVGTYALTAVFQYTDPSGDSVVVESCSTANPDLLIPAASCAGASASAYANMNAGALISSLAVADNPFGGGSGYAEQGIFDFLHFNGATNGKNVLITATGTGAATFANGFAYLGLALSFSKDASSPPFGVTDAFGEATSVNGGSDCSNPSEFPDVTVCTNSGRGALSVSIDVPLDAVDPDNGLYLQATAGCIENSGGFGGGTCSVSDPITITLPAGVTYTTSSGQFLTASPVPLPASAWLLLSALGSLALIARRSPVSPIR